MVSRYGENRNSTSSASARHARAISSKVDTRFGDRSLLGVFFGFLGSTPIFFCLIKKASPSIAGSYGAVGKRGTT
jgi:hypothetical protein